MDYKKEYRLLHKKHPDVFAGNSVLAHVETIKELVEDLRGSNRKGVRINDIRIRMLDFGCGKGYQYTKHRVHNIWQIETPFLYDIGVPEFRKPIPENYFDCAICTDVMEHIEEPDIDGILEKIFGAINPEKKTFVFFSISCRPAKKTFEDGRNVHRTIQLPEWWQDRMKPFKFRASRVILSFS